MLKLRKLQTIIYPTSKEIIRCLSTSPNANFDTEQTFNLLDKSYTKDDFTNITPKIVARIGRNLHNNKQHPLGIIKLRILNYFYKTFMHGRGNPDFSMHDNLSPVVSVEQNFDSLLIPKDHVSRSKSDCYYLNREYLLRAHMTAHQAELIRSGLDNFLYCGEVYRRDEIDKTHYPIFHQMDGVRLRTKEQLFKNEPALELFETGNNTNGLDAQEKQACHSLDAVKLLELELKNTLEGLAKELFGPEVRYRWVDTVFPFTLPSWELEIFYENDWMEVLGCGIMRQPIITNSGVDNRVGWAFGLGIERLAMCLFKIPDIRLFWSTDSGFLNQFKNTDLNKNIIYKPISQYPQCKNDISFWLPEDKEYNSNDFYDLVRNVGGDIVEQVSLFDKFKHPKSGKLSHSYRIIYRHMEKTLTQREASAIHKRIETAAVKTLNVTIR